MTEFEAMKGQFWILDVKIQSKKSTIVFQKLEDAVEKTVEYMIKEPDITKVEPKNYCLNEVNVLEEKFELKQVSWFVILAAYAKQIKK